MCTYVQYMSHTYRHAYAPMYVRTHVQLIGVKESFLITYIHV